MSTTTGDAVADLLSRLEGVKPAGLGRWCAKCPSHDDRRASLSISAGADGRALVKCHAGCTIQELLAAIGLKISDLFSGPASSGNGKHRGNRRRGRAVAHYVYRAEDNSVIARKVRFEPKDFRWQHPNKIGEFIAGRNGLPIPLYRLPALLNAREDDCDSWILVTEGEKDADRATLIGFIATTSPDGASKDTQRPKWRPHFNEQLRGLRVAIICDNDDAGRAHGVHAANQLIGTAREVKLIRALPSVENVAGGDLSDYLDHGGSAESLQAVIDAAPVFKPEVRSSQILPEATATRFELSEVGMAERVVAKFGADFRFVPAFKKFIVWDGRRFKLDDDGAIKRLIKQAIRRTKIDASKSKDPASAALWNHAHQCESNAKIKAIAECISRENGVSIHPDALDANPWNLNVENGTIDLRTGQVRGHDRAELITKIARVHFDPGSTCPIFHQFIERVTDANSALAQFLQRMAGYSATGETSERCLFMPYGIGANGKTTLLFAIGELLGDYATTLPAESLMVRRDGGIPNDIARLKGARFVSAIESEEGRRFAESLVKSMTGGADLLTARMLYGEFFSFRPTFKLFIATNHKPIVRGTDEAIWDRIRLIPFTVRIPDDERDGDLPAKLRAEYPGILNWMIAGAIAWHAGGLGVPDEVRAATSEYRNEMDTLGDFIDECCEVFASAIADATPLFDRYKIWCSLHNETSCTQTRFGTQLASRGFVSDRDSRSGRKIWKGIGLKEEC